MKDRHPPAQYAPDPAAHRQVPRTSNHRRGGARYTGCSEPADPRGTHPAHEWLRQSRLGHRSEGIILAALFTPLFPGVDCDDRPTANRHQPKLLPPDRAAPTAYTAFGSSPRCGSDARRFAPVSRSFSNGPPRRGEGWKAHRSWSALGPIEDTWSLSQPRPLAVPRQYPRREGLPTARLGTAVRVGSGHWPILPRREENRVRPHPPNRIQRWDGHSPTLPAPASGTLNSLCRVLFTVRSLYLCAIGLVPVFEPCEGWTSQFKLQFQEDLLAGERAALGRGGHGKPHPPLREADC